MEYHHLRGPGEKVFVPNEDQSVIVVCSFLNVDSFTVPDAYPGPEAGKIVRVTHRHAAMPCPCCHKPMVHLWSNHIGVIECTTSSNFYCYEVKQEWIDAAKRVE